MYIDVHMGVATKAPRYLSIGALSTARASAFTVANKAGPFSSYNTAIATNTTRPNISAGRNIGIGIAADVINQQLLSIYERGDLNLRAYMLSGKIYIRDTDPKRLSDFDIRVRTRLAAPVELTFTGSDSALTADALVPTLRIFIDIYQGGEWHQVGLLDVSAQVPAQVVANSKNLRLLVNSNKISLSKLLFDADPLVEAFEPAIDEILNIIKPELGKAIQSAAVIKIDFLTNSGISNIKTKINANQHIGVDVYADFSQAF